MPRLAAILALLLLPVSAADDLGPRLAAFHQHYNVFMRAFLGCPSKAHEVEECNQKLGRIDYAEYSKARSAAETLFDLHR